jgi:hypothetical protein
MPWNVVVPAPTGRRSFIEEVERVETVLGSTHASRSKAEDLHEYISNPCHNKRHFGADGGSWDAMSLSLPVMHKCADETCRESKEYGQQLCEEEDRRETGRELGWSGVREVRPAMAYVRVV